MLYTYALNPQNYLMNTLMEYSVRLQETNVIYTYTVYRQNAGIYVPKAMYFCILSGCEYVQATYFDVFYESLIFYFKWRRK